MRCAWAIRLLTMALASIGSMSLAGGQEPPSVPRGWYTAVQGGGSAPKRICFRFDPFSKEIDDVTLAKARATSSGDTTCPAGVLVTRPFRPEGLSQFEFAKPVDDPPPAVFTSGALPWLLFNVILGKDMRVILLRRKKDAATGQIKQIYLEPLP